MTDTETVTPEVEDTTRVWLRVARFTALVIVGWTIVLQLIVGVVIPPVLAVGVAFAVLVVVLGIGKRWTGLVATLLGLAAVGGNLPSLVEELSHPSSVAFILTLIPTTAAMVLLIAGLAAFFGWTLRPRLVYWPAAIVVVVGSVLSLIAAAGVESIPKVEGDLTVVAKASYFTPDSLTTSPGPVSIWIDNQDPARHTFTAPQLGIDIDIAGFKSQRVEFEAAPGEYLFFCTVVGHEGMTVVVDVE